MPPQSPLGPDEKLPNHPARDAAFTLVELLVVIAIIGILTALIFSGVSGVKKSANSAKSMSNLRQLFLATQSYAADNGNFLPGATAMMPKNYSGIAMILGILDDYGANGTRVDPAAPKLVFGYGYNTWLSPGTTKWDVRGQSKDDIWGNAANSRFWSQSCFTFFDIRKPARTILFAATGHPTDGYYAQPYTVAATNTPTVIGADRHVRGKIQVVMCDGHTELLDQVELSKNSAPYSEYWTNGPEAAAP